MIKLIQAAAIVLMFTAINVAFYTVGRSDGFENGKEIYFCDGQCRYTEAIHMVAFTIDDYDPEIYPPERKPR